MAGGSTSSDECRHSLLMGTAPDQTGLGFLFGLLQEVYYHKSVSLEKKSGQSWKIPELPRLLYTDLLLDSSATTRSQPSLRRY